MKRSRLTNASRLDGKPVVSYFNQENPWLCRGDSQSLKVPGVKCFYTCSEKAPDFLRRLSFQLKSNGILAG
jgi:hypothetical protein